MNSPRTALCHILATGRPLNLTAAPKTRVQELEALLGVNLRSGRQSGKTMMAMAQMKARFDAMMPDGEPRDRDNDADDTFGEVDRAVAENDEVTQGHDPEEDEEED